LSSQEMRMNMNNNIFYILVMFAASLIVRTLPISLIHKKINNRFIKSFLYYVPYVTLAVMTFPAIIWTTITPLVGFIVFVVAIILAYKDKSMVLIAILCCALTYLLQLFIK